MFTECRWYIQFFSYAWYLKGLTPPPYDEFNLHSPTSHEYENYAKVSFIVSFYPQFSQVSLFVRLFTWHSG